MTKLPPMAEMQRAYLSRDASYNGVFWVAVKTTGIFCRPTCKVRSPLPKNVEFFRTTSEALLAGYRPCKRCRPLSVDEQPDWAKSLIAEVENDPSVRLTEADLRSRGTDPATVRRHFQKQYGMTFQAYARGRRLAGAFHNIRNGKRLDNTIVNSGYESHSGFREAFTKAFGQSPANSHRTEAVLLAWFPSPLGPLVVGATNEGVCLLEFSNRERLDAQVNAVKKQFGLPVIVGSNKHLKRLESELGDYFKGKLRTFTVPLVFPGSPFQRRVWQQLLKVPYGKTQSYHDIAVGIGNPAAVRAVGRANGMNRIAIVIPCHRVVNKNGDMGGYGGGLRRKEFLLNLERTGS